eukprot:XP_012826372.1 PREDICTED: cadherin EGF LAG seven-pass G-type receptor 2-like [Xenopus tropicalis]
MELRDVHSGCEKRYVKSINQDYGIYQEFHYRPKGSETCLPCDCYPIGSSSRACDQETGQCYCRPGLIGLIYDGCPKTSTAGVWWPRTKFGVPAAVPCPLPCWLKEKVKHVWVLMCMS